MIRFLGTILIIVLVLGGATFLWRQYNAAPSASETDSAAVDIDPTIEGELAQLRQLKTIHLDTAVLKEDSFRLLIAPPPVPGIEENNGQQSPPPQGSSLPLTHGRVNPFLPF